MPSLFEKNLEVLGVRHPVLARRLLETAPVPPEDLLETRSGAFTIRVEGEDGRKLLLHSRFDPEEEARRMVEGIEAEAEEAGTFLCLGMGLGYHLPRLLDRKGPRSFLIVIEASLAAVRTALERIDLTGVFSDNRTFLLAGEYASELFPLLRELVFHVLSGNLTLVPHRASLQLFPSYYDEASERIHEFARTGAMMVRTNMVLARKTFINRFANLPLYLRSPGKRCVDGHYAGYPGIIVSAGPSLGRNLHLLERAKGKAVLIAVSTALKVMIARGIHPDFTVVLDYSTLSRRYFDVIDPEVSRNIPLFADSRASPEAMDAYSGPIFFGEDAVLGSLLREIPLGLGPLEQGSTVAHTAFYCAHGMGCDPIILVGQDLSYSYGINHVPGTAIFDSWRPLLNRFRTLDDWENESILRMGPLLMETTDCHGNPIFTEECLLAYKKEFEMQFRARRCRVYNCTEGGLAIEGAEPLRLSEAIERFCGRDLPGPPPALSDAGGRADLAAAAAESLRARRKEFAAMRDRYARMIEVYRKIARRIEKKKDPNPLIAKIHRHRDQLKEFETNYQILSALIATDTYLRTVRDRRIAAEKIEGTDKALAQSLRDEEFIQGLKEGADYMIELIDDGLRRLGPE